MFDFQKAEQLHNTLIRKYSQNKDMWANFGTFLYKHDKMEAARKLLQRSLKSLPLRNRKYSSLKFAEFNICKLISVYDRHIC